MRFKEPHRVHHEGVITLSHANFSAILRTQVWIKVRFRFAFVRKGEWIDAVLVCV